MLKFSLCVVLYLFCLYNYLFINVVPNESVPGNNNFHIVLLLQCCLLVELVNTVLYQHKIDLHLSAIVTGSSNSISNENTVLISRSPFSGIDAAYLSSGYNEAICCPSTQRTHQPCLLIAKRYRSGMLLRNDR